MVACGSGGVLAPHFEISGLETCLEFCPVLSFGIRVELAPLATCDVVSSSFRYDVVGPAEDGRLRGLVKAFCCECDAVFDLHE
jgi:hypothetical protein